MKPWEGRFSQRTDEEFEKFSQSISFDKELALYDIKLNLAYAKALKGVGVLTEEEEKRLRETLLEIEKEVKEGKVVWKEELEDVHMNLEYLLTERLGDLGKKIHTGRSRNDQVVSDVRLYLKEKIKEIVKLLKEVQETLKGLAKRYFGYVMPSYTHLQRAQPVLISHYLLSFKELFLEDEERFLEVYRRVDRLPLGSGAVAGSDFKIDRFFLAKELNFYKVLKNSMSATYDRAFISDFLYACAVVGIHLSRLSEDLIIYSTEEFSLIELPENLCTGSSMMPQKKNPDALELIRGKSARLISNLLRLLILEKALPTSYNRDLQEDKEPLFDSVKTLIDSLKVMNKVLKGLKFKTEVAKSYAGNLLLITDLANYLVKKGVPFRQAHRICGNLVKYLTKKGKRLEEVSLEELKKFSKEFEGDVLKLMEPKESVKNKKTFGSTNPDLVKEQLEL